MRKIVYIKHSELEEAKCPISEEMYFDDTNLELDKKNFEIGKVYEVSEDKGWYLRLVGTKYAIFNYQYVEAIPKNPLSEIVYPNYKTSNCGKYLYEDK